MRRLTMRAPRLRLRWTVAWAPALWTGRRARMLALLGLPAAGIAAALWFVQPDVFGRLGADLREGIADAAARGGMTVQRVYTTGRQNTPTDAIIAALEVEVGTPILRLDPQAARRRIEAIGWVESASVERRLPSTVFVRLVERTPIALWRQPDGLVALDRAGVVMGAEPVPDFAHLLVVEGEDAPRHLPALIGAMARTPGLAARVREAERVGGRRWDLRLDMGLEVRLPEGEIGAAWARLVTEIETRRLLEKAVAAVDLRLEDRTILRLHEPQEPAGETET